MKDKIRRTIDMSCEHMVATPSKCKERLAKEINTLTYEHYMEFMEWMEEKP